MNLITLLALMLLNPGLSSRDNPSVTAPGDTIRTWKTAASLISADPLGQFYIIRGSLLVRYDNNGDSSSSWSEPSTGPVTLIDSGDPMRILIYQKDFNLLRFLNNRLTPLSEPVRLDDLGITNPLAVAAAHDGGFWVLDGFTMRIRHIGQQLTTLVESMPLDLPSGAAPAGCRMVETGDRIYLHVPGSVIRVFDLFANPVKRIPVQATDFRPYGDRLIIIRPGSVTLWKDPVTDEEPVFKQHGNDILDACLFRNRLLVMTAVGVTLLSR